MFLLENEFRVPASRTVYTRRREPFSINPKGRANEQTRPLCCCCCCSEFRTRGHIETLDDQERCEYYDGHVYSTVTRRTMDQSVDCPKTNFCFSSFFLFLFLPYFFFVPGRRTSVTYVSEKGTTPCSSSHSSFQLPNTISLPRRLISTGPARGAFKDFCR